MWRPSVLETLVYTTRYEMIFYTLERTFRAFIDMETPDDHHIPMSITQTQAPIERVRRYVRCEDGTANDAEGTRAERIIICSEYFTILILLLTKYTDDATADGHRLDTVHT